MLPSEWCREMYEKTLNPDYITLYNHWKGARFMNQDQINFVCQLIKEFVDFTDLSEEELVKLEEILDKEIL